MIIAQDIRGKWSAIASHGDARRIQERMAESERVTVQTIYNALQHGRCSDVVFLAIAGYYREKEEKLLAAIGGGNTPAIGKDTKNFQKVAQPAHG